jgi:hypothetical protein
MRNAFVAHNSLLGYRPKFHGFTEKANLSDQKFFWGGKTCVEVHRRP